MYLHAMEQLTLIRSKIYGFPPDFMFQLRKEEWETLKFQIGILKSGRGEHSKYLPHAFTEQNDINEDSRVTLQNKR